MTTNTRLVEVLRIAQLNRRSFLQKVAGGVCAGGVSASALWAQAESSPRIADVPWLAEVQSPSANVVVPKATLSPLVAANDGLAEWKIRRDVIQQRWLDFLGKMPDRPDLTWKRISSEVVQGVRRDLIEYQSEPNWPTQAYIVQPDDKPPALRPAVAVFHSTVPHSIRQPAGVEGKPEKAFAWELAKRGFVTICPRNFLWPDNTHIDTDLQTKRFQQRHPQTTGMAKMLYDARLAIDILQRLPHVDPQRIGAVGHSLGAKEVLYLAAFDDRIQAAVSSEGGIGVDFSNWDAAWYLGAKIREQNDLQHHQLLALSAPKPFLLIGGDSADGVQSWSYVSAAAAVYRRYGQPVRLGLLNHGQGHSVPKIAEERIYSWLETYLS